ncbi:MAG: hypothetical protein WKG32_06740 [Gemmatimonadaceae bacterium]
MRRKDAMRAGAGTAIPTVYSSHVRLAAYAPALALSALFALSACGKDNKNNPTQPATRPHETTVPTATSGFVEARTSQIVTDGSPPSQVFDDFTLSTGVTVRTVGWQGIYCVQQVNAPAPTPTATSFTVSFYSDVSGRPNTATPLQRATYTVAQAGQVFEKNVSGLTCGTAANTTWPFYRYSVTLATPFTATAGTKYWISIQATTPSYAVYFGWRDGTVDNRLSLQLFQNVYTTYNVDRAYSLAP